MDSTYGQHSTGQGKANQVTCFFKLLLLARGRSDTVGVQAHPVDSLAFVQSAQSLLVTAVKEILSGFPLPEGPFCVADIGSSVGNNSIRELATIVQSLDQQVLKLGKTAVVPLTTVVPLTKLRQEPETLETT